MRGARGWPQALGAPLSRHVESTLEETCGAPVAAAQAPAAQSSNDSEHGIYAEFTDGLVIRDSYFYGSAGYGLHFYPSAQNSLVEYTVVDGNATVAGNGYNVTFSGEQTPSEYPLPFSSANNRIVNSIISFPARNGNVVSYYPGNAPAPVGNEVAFNCAFGGSPNFHVYPGPLGYVEVGNIMVDPRYVDRAATNFSVQEPLCMAKGPR